jgi:hypothetical protein
VGVSEDLNKSSEYVIIPGRLDQVERIHQVTRIAGSIELFLDQACRLFCLAYKNFAVYRQIALRGSAFYPVPVIRAITGTPPFEASLRLFKIAPSLSLARGLHSTIDRPDAFSLHSP